MLVLALDTASQFCSAALAENGTIIAKTSDNIGKGHAEHLLEQVNDLMQQAGKTFADIDRIAVNIGPGSFTGIRVGVAAARGLALALNKPAIGISSFEALHYQVELQEKSAQKSAMCVVFKASQGHIYWQYFAADFDATQNAAVDSANNSTPQNTMPEALTEYLYTQGEETDTLYLAGNGGEAISALLPTEWETQLKIVDNQPTADITAFAMLASAISVSASHPSPIPLYMRAPDAKPQSAKPLSVGKKQFRKHAKQANTTLARKDVSKSEKSE